MKLDRIINSLNGYAFHGNDRDERFLQRHGIERLTTTRDLDQMAHNPETLLERLLNETFPNGYNDNDPYFIVRRDGVQYLVLVHAGQWFVGVNAADETTGALLHAE